MSTTPPRPTPETDAEVKDFDAPWLYYVNADFARKLERERDEAREELQQWKMLCAWGGTPEHIDQFIKGQQSRIHQAQDIEETCEQLERERDEAREQLQAMRDELEKVCQQRDAWAMRCDKLGIIAMREAIKEAIDSLHKCSRIIGAPVCDAAYNSAQAALTKLQPFIKL